jgi:hypothetical protein
VFREEGSGLDQSPGGIIREVKTSISCELRMSRSDPEWDARRRNQTGSGLLPVTTAPAAVAGAVAVLTNGRPPCTCSMAVAAESPRSPDFAPALPDKLSSGSVDGLGTALLASTVTEAPARSASAISMPI